jgi:hypothetical protein
LSTRGEALGSALAPSCRDSFGAFRSSLRGPVLAKRIGVSRALLRDALFGLVCEFACALGLSNGVSWALIRFMWFFDRRQQQLLR